MPIELTLSMNQDDAERLMQAFKDGKLAELGVLDIKFPEAIEKKWTGTESQRRDKPKQDDVPPRG